MYNAYAEKILLYSFKIIAVFCILTWLYFFVSDEGTAERNNLSPPGCYNFSVYA